MDTLNTATEFESISNYFSLPVEQVKSRYGKRILVSTMKAGVEYICQGHPRLFESPFFRKLTVEIRAGSLSAENLPDECGPEEPCLLVKLRDQVSVDLFETFLSLHAPIVSLSRKLPDMILLIDIDNVRREIFSHLGFICARRRRRLVKSMLRVYPPPKRLQESIPSSDIDEQICSFDLDFDLAEMEFRALISILDHVAVISPYNLLTIISDPYLSIHSDQLLDYVDSGFATGVINVKSGKSPSFNVFGQSFSTNIPPEFRHNILALSVVEKMVISSQDQEFSGSRCYFPLNSPHWNLTLNTAQEMDLSLDYAVGGWLSGLDMHKTILTGPIVTGVACFFLQRECQSLASWLDRLYPNVSTHSIGHVVSHESRDEEAERILGQIEAVLHGRKRFVMMLESDSGRHLLKISGVTRKAERGSIIRVGIEHVSAIDIIDRQVALMVNAEDEAQLDSIASQHFSAISKKWPQATIEMVVNSKPYYSSRVEGAESQTAAEGAVFSHWYRISSPSVRDYLAGFRNVDIVAGDRMEVAKASLPMERLWRGHEAGIMACFSCLCSLVDESFAEIRKMDGMYRPSHCATNFWDEIGSYRNRGFRWIDRAKCLCKFTDEMIKRSDCSPDRCVGHVNLIARMNELGVRCGNFELREEDDLLPCPRIDCSRTRGANGVWRRLSDRYFKPKHG